VIDRLVDRAMSERAETIPVFRIEAARRSFVVPAMAELVSV
jgi:hypothetical protein